jgi:hypothetical protein
MHPRSPPPPAYLPITRATSARMVRVPAPQADSAVSVYAFGGARTSTGHSVIELDPCRTH